MSSLKAVKSITPLTLRLFLKKRLPVRLVKILTANNPPPVSPAPPPKKIVKKLVDCPICGMQDLGVHEKNQTACPGCGSLDYHRHMALAAYANLPPSNDRRIMALGPDPILPLICEDMSGALHVESLSHTPLDLNSEIDLCIHSGWIDDDLLQAEAALAHIDAMLAHSGKQIFAIDIGAIESDENKRTWTLHDVLEWLRQKGWSDSAAFSADTIYGKGAAELFRCASQGSNGKAIFVLGKR